MSMSIHRAICTGWSLLIVAACGSCNVVEGILHQTASFGGSTAGQRGSTDAIFINNTPYRAIFTLGAYDNLDRNTNPELVPFSPNDEFDLEAGATTGPISVTCHRVFSIGGATMIAIAQKNLASASLPTDALVPGVSFSSAPLGDPDESEATEGQAAPLDLLIGLDFPCESVIVFRFEINDAGPEAFRVDYEVIPPAAAEQ